MSRNKPNSTQNSQKSLRDLQLIIDDIRKKRDDLNAKTKEYINKLQDNETEISNLLKIAKVKFKKRRDYWNDKVKQLKEKKIEYKNLLEKLTEEKKVIHKKNKLPNTIISIKQIERKIDNLERRIEIENLDISEENALIDKIKELAEIKQNYLAEQQNSDLFRIERKSEIVRINLNKIYEQLNRWSNKSQEYHAKMLETFQKVDQLKENKRIMEEELIQNKKSADRYHEQYLNLMTQRRKISKGKKPYKPTRKQSTRPNQISKRSEILEKIKQDKLATALEKQKAGKKLNLFEARLILEKSKD